MTRPSWVEGAEGSGFDVDHLPYGIFTPVADPDERPRVGVRIADRVLDVASAAPPQVRWRPSIGSASLGPLMAAGPKVWDEVRAWLTDLLTDPRHAESVSKLLVPVDAVTTSLPVEVADYVDFYASIDHASNVGRIMRPGSEPLLPNWRHLPVGYHGRAGTVVVSGTDVRRPCGQRKGPHEDAPTVGPSRRLDVEAELGFVVGVPSRLGTPVPASAFGEHVFGVVGLNDWSARDIQGWEYVPLGPFLGKSFATSVSAWVTPLAALEHARCDLPEQDPRPLDYLHVEQPAGFDIQVELELNGEVVSRPPYSSMYWGPAQMLAHLTVNGASLRTGDLFASGTISGPARDQRGSLLELGWGGREPFLVGGRERAFLEDGDEVVLRYAARGARGPLTLGEVRGRVTPAVPTPDAVGEPA